MTTYNASDAEEAEVIAEEVRQYGGKFARYNVVAGFPDMHAAKKAIDSLEWARIDAADVWLRGRKAAEATDPGTNEDLGRTDRNIARDIVAGAGIGLVVGAVLGAAAGLLFYALDDVLGFWFTVIGGVLALGIVGAFVGGLMRLDANDDAELTYHEVGPGPVLVEVSSDDRSVVERGTHALEKAKPVRLYHYDANGRPVAA